MNCHVEIFIDNCWKTAAVFEPDPQTLDKGVAGGSRLEYDIDYAIAYRGNRAAELIPGLTVGFELFRFEQWPPFLETFYRQHIDVFKFWYCLLYNLFCQECL